MFKMDIEKELIINLKRGSRSAFDKLYNIYSSLLYGFVYTLTKSHADAKDVVQETFLKVWVKKESISLEYSFKSYLFSISKNMIIDSIRKNKNIYFYGDESVDDVSPSSDTEVEELIFLKELTGQINIAKSRMTNQQKLIFELNKEQGYSVNEISDQLQISNKTVYNTLSTAVKVLKIVLASNKS